jgi:hypothetical protein
MEAVMSSFKIVQRPNSLFELPDVLNANEEVAETGGIAFSNERCVELIRNDTGRLGLLDSSNKKPAERIEYQGRIFVPPTIHPSMLEVLTLPTGRSPSGSTANIFSRMCTLFMERSIPEEGAKKLTYWALSTWFAELYPLAPCLVITGSRPEASLVLQLLTCVTRHSLPLADISFAGFRSLPMHIQPTLLIGRLSPGMWKVVSTSNYPRAYLPIREGLADLYCAKALYAGIRPVVDAPDGSFRIHLAPFHGKLPVISELTQRRLAADLQPLLVDYRIRHIGQVRDSDFDVPALGSEVRMLARVLGSAIVEAPELRADLVSLLQQYQEEIGPGNTFNEESIAVQALLGHSHSEETDQLLYIGQLADTSNRLLKERGSREELEPKALGWIIRNELGFSPKRHAKGFAIKLTVDARRRIHQLARDFQVLVPDETPANCTHCADILASDGAEGKFELGVKTRDISPA